MTSMIKSLVLMTLMLASVALAMTLKPTTKIAEQRPKIELARIIPQEFNDWSVDESIIPLLIDPEVKKNLDEIYNDVLARTYVNSSGHRVMLSIAYGSEQSDSMRVHKPEVCYGAQGFEISNKHSSVLNSVVGDLSVITLVAKHGLRVEPITYWITIGNKISTSGIMQKITQLKYGLVGEVPDGVLFRVSTISGPTSGFEVQQQFINDLLEVLSEDNRQIIVGELG